MSHFVFAKEARKCLYVFPYTVGKVVQPKNLVHDAIYCDTFRVTLIGVLGVRVCKEEVCLCGCVCASMSCWVRS
jgi:hypothetical protein